jgi:hypothetical protein
MRKRDQGVVQLVTGHGCDERLDRRVIQALQRNALHPSLAS